MRVLSINTSVGACFMGLVQYPVDDDVGLVAVELVSSSDRAASVQLAILEQPVEHRAIYIYIVSAENDKSANNP